MRKTNDLKNAMVIFETSLINAARDEFLRIHSTLSNGLADSVSISNWGWNEDGELVLHFNAVLTFEDGDVDWHHTGYIYPEMPIPYWNIF